MYHLSEKRRPTHCLPKLYCENMLPLACNVIKRGKVSFATRKITVVWMFLSFRVEVFLLPPIVAYLPIWIVWVTKLCAANLTEALVAMSKNFTRLIGESFDVWMFETYYQYYKVNYMYMYNVFLGFQFRLVFSLRNLRLLCDPFFLWIDDSCCFINLMKRFAAFITGLKRPRTPDKIDTTQRSGKHRHANHKLDRSPSPSSSGMRIVHPRVISIIGFCFLCWQGKK